MGQSISHSQEIMRQAQEINISLLSSEEAGPASKLAMETFRTHASTHCSQEGTDEFANYAGAENILKRHCHGHETWVAKAGDKIAGVLEIRFPNHISMLFVMEAYQGRGIGRSLMDRAMIQLLGSGQDVRTLTVHSSPNAVPAYRKFGFRECGSLQEKNGIRYQPMEMKLKEETDQFYKGLSPFYHLIYRNWEESTGKQANDLNSMIREKCGGGMHSVLDVSCGIGTQSLGLAQLGYEVTASDLSPEEVDRAKKEAAKQGLEISFSVADMRESYICRSREFDVVISCDNSVPHLLTDADILISFKEFYRCTRPGGICIISVRDYEKEDLSKRQIRPYGVREESGVRWLIWQVWEPHGNTYDVTMNLLEDRGGSEFLLHKGVSTYYAVSIWKLMKLMEEAGFAGVARHDGRFFQPLITGSRLK